MAEPLMNPFGIEVKQFPTQKDFSLKGFSNGDCRRTILELRMQSPASLWFVEHKLIFYIASTLICLCPYLVTWTRDNIKIQNSSNYGIKAEGERYSLLIKCAKPSDAGTYCVTAANEAGKTSSSATLSIKPGKHELQHCIGWVTLYLKLI